VGDVLPGVEPFERFRPDVDRTSVMLNLARGDVADYLYHALHKLVEETESATSSST
jgi:hypothetical protein